MTTGDRIRHYRLKLGWTLKRLSEVSGVQQGTISALELRSSNKSDYIPQIAKAFGLTVEQLADTATDWDVSQTAAEDEIMFSRKDDAEDLPSPPTVREAEPGYAPRVYSPDALSLAREYDAIRSKRWQKTAFAYCMQIMNRDPLMMAWLATLTSNAKTPAAAPQSHTPATDR